MTEPLLLQQLESPSGTGRDEPRSQTTLPDSHQQQTRMQTSTPILTGRYAQRSSVGLPWPGGGCYRRDRSGTAVDKNSAIVYAQLTIWNVDGL